MKSEEEIQRAHDLLAGFRLGDVPHDLGPREMTTLTTALDVLCWVLEHEHNLAFIDNLVKLERLATSQGYVLRSRAG